MMLQDSPSSDQAEAYYNFYFWFNLALFIAYAGLLCLNHKLFTFQMDSLAIVMSLIYLISFSLRMMVWAIFWIQDGTEAIIDYLEIAIAACSVSIWMILYKFTFEMLFVQVKLQFQTVNDRISKEATNKKIRTFCLLVLFNCQLIMLSITIYKLFNKETQFEILAGISIFNMIVRLIKMAFDIYMFQLFLRLFSYFAQKKIQKLITLGRSFSYFHKFMIAWAITLVVINFIHSVYICFFGIIMFTHLKVNVILRQIFKFALVPAIDFLTASTLLYLFKKQMQIVEKLKSKEQALNVQMKRPNYSTQAIIDILKNQSTSSSQLIKPSSALHQQQYCDIKTKTDNTSLAQKYHDSLVQPSHHNVNSNQNESNSQQQKTIQCETETSLSKKAEEASIKYIITYSVDDCAFLRRYLYDNVVISETDKDILFEKPTDEQV